MVFSLILFLIFFSAIVLYLAFRIKETFREEKKRSSTLIKVTFMIGALFLAGGIFYFAANNLNLNPNPGTTSTPGTTPTPVTNPTPNTTPTTGPQPTVTMTASYPSAAKMSTKITVSFTLLNPTTATAHAATIQAPILLQNLAVISSTHTIIGNVIKVGDIPPGTTIVSLDLSTPSKAGTVTDTVGLLYEESTSPQTREVSISVRGGP